MPVIIRPELMLALSVSPRPGSVAIEAWTLGIDFKMEVYVLNLYSGGVNYPEIVSKDAVAGITQSLAQAKLCGAVRKCIIFQVLPRLSCTLAKFLRDGSHARPRNPHWRYWRNRCLQDS